MPNTELEINASLSVENQMTGLETREGKYLTFSLADQLYGIGILKVREIIGLMAITAVPRTPDFVKGVINLRGKVIPIVDFRLKFRMAAADQTDQTCIIVVEVGGITGTMLTGVIVDSVSEVVDIREGDIENAPSFGIEADTAFILGMAKVKDKVTTLLDIDRVLDIKQIEKVINQ